MKRVRRTEAQEPLGTVIQERAAQIEVLVVGRIVDAPSSPITLAMAASLRSGDGGVDAQVLIELSTRQNASHEGTL